MSLAVELVSVLVFVIRVYKLRMFVVVFSGR